MDSELARLILKNANDSQKAELLEAVREQRFDIQIVDLPLKDARLETSPYEIKFPFKSFVVLSASDPSAEAYIRLGTRDSLQSVVPIKINNAYGTDQIVPGAYIHWAAQAGKTMKILFLLNARFNTNSTISVNSGGVSINDGASFNQSSQTLTAGVVTQIFPQDFDRKSGTFENATGGDVYVGDNTITGAVPTRGILVKNGAFLKWRNTAALFALAASTGDISTVSEK